MLGRKPRPLLGNPIRPRPLTARPRPSPARRDRATARRAGGAGPSGGWVRAGGGAGRARRAGAGAGRRRAGRLAAQRRGGGAGAGHRLSVSGAPLRRPEGPRRAGAVGAAARGGGGGRVGWCGAERGCAPAPPRGRDPGSGGRRSVREPWSASHPKRPGGARCWPAPPFPRPPPAGGCEGAPPPPPARWPGPGGRGARSPPPPPPPLPAAGRALPAREYRGALSGTYRLTGSCRQPRSSSARRWPHRRGAPSRPPGKAWPSCLCLETARLGSTAPRFPGGRACPGAPAGEKR